MQACRRIFTLSIWKDPGVPATLVVAAAQAARYLAWTKMDARVDGDAHYIWLFVRSLAFDADLDFTNDYALCGDRWHLGVDEGGHRPANPFYFGPSIFLAPILFVARHLLRFAPDAPLSWRVGCSGPLLAYTGALSIVASALIVFFGYRAARRFYGEVPSAIAVLVIGLASPLNNYGTGGWSMSHVWAALGVATAVLATVRFWEKPTSRRAFAAGAACALGFLVRAPDAVFALGWIGAAVDHLAREARVDKRRAVRSAVFRAVAFGAGFLSLAWVQLLVWQTLYGSPLVIPQGRLYLQLAHAHPFLLLFGARSGLLYWTPLMWLGVAGLPLLLRVRGARFMFLGLVLGAVIHHYVASSAIPWTGAATYGARVQTSLAAPLLVATAAAVTPILRSLERRKTRGALLVLAALTPWLFATWYIPNAGVAWDAVVPAPRLYGAAVESGVGDIYNAVGNPWTIPATLVFRARYGAGPPVFDALASEGLFEKNYRTLELNTDDTLSFAAPPSAYYAEGGTKTDAGVRLEPHRTMRFLTSIYWPWVSHIELKVTSDAPADLTIRSAGFFRRYDIGTIHVDGPTTREISVPRGAFDSGINEVFVTASAPVTLEHLRWIDRYRHDTRVHVLK